jgi:hypothetical protein
MDNDYKVGTRALRLLIVTVGFLPGLWLYIGVDPEAQISYVIIGEIAKSISSMGPYPDMSAFGQFVYTVIGIGSAILSWIFVYEVGGFWGVLAVLAAFIGGLCVTSFGIWLFIAALLVAPFLPVDPEHSL